MKTSIIIPVIRPEKAQRCIAAIIENTGPYDAYEILEEADVDRIGCPKMVKRLVEQSSGELVLFLGDDCIPQKDFLKNALKAMAELPDGWGLVGFNDNTGRNLPTHWLADKRLLEHLGGEFFHTGYTHCFCDNELMLRAAELDRYVYANDATIEHDHAIIKGEEIEDKDLKRVYSKEVYNKDRLLFSKRYNNNWATPDPNEVKLGIGLPLANRQCDNQFWISFLKMGKPDCVLLVPSIEVYEFQQDIASIRNDLVEQAINSGCTHLIMMDTDQVYPEDTIFKMMGHNKNVVSAPVHRRYPPFDLILFRNIDGKMVPVPDDERYTGDLIKIDSTGTGCILYNIEVFLKIDPPWFEITTENGAPLGEDINFCRKLRRIGEPVYVDTSIKIPHLAMVEINRTFYELYKLAHKNTVEMQKKSNAGALKKQT